MSDQVEGEPSSHLTPELESFIHELSPHLWISALQETDRHIVDVITMAAIAEGFIAELISEYFAPDRAKAQYLADNVTRKLSNDRKLAILAYIISQSEWEKEFADLVPKLREVFNMRNLLAHSYSTGNIAIEGGDIIFEHARRHEGTPKSLLIKDFMPLPPVLADRVACGRRPSGAWVAGRSGSGRAAWS